MGGSQSSSRALQSQLTPVASAEFFGFFGVVGKFSAIFGPLIYGLMIQLTGSLRWGILSLALLFALGLLSLPALIWKKAKQKNSRPTARNFFSPSFAPYQRSPIRRQWTLADS